MRVAILSVLILFGAAMIVHLPSAAHAQEDRAEEDRMREKKLKEAGAMRDAEMQKRLAANAADEAKKRAAIMAGRAENPVVLTAPPGAHPLQCIVVAQIRAPEQNAPSADNIVTAHVLQTLAGIDETGVDIRLLSSQPLQPRQSYLVTFKRDATQEWGEVVSAEEPTREGIEAVKKRVAEAKQSVAPARKLWIRQVDDFSGGPVTEFVLQSSGHFTFVILPGPPDQPVAPGVPHSGELPKPVQKELLESVEAMLPLASNRAGRIAVRWTDETGRQRFKLFGSEHAQAAALIQRVTALATEAPATAPAIAPTTGPASAPSASLARPPTPWNSLRQ